MGRAEGVVDVTKGNTKEIMPRDYSAKASPINRLILEQEVISL